MGQLFFHHLFTGVTYSPFAGQIAANCFLQNESLMFGDYRKAMSQTSTGEHPHGWTPLHCLCHGSDDRKYKKDIISSMLENSVVDITMFDSVREPKVIVFLTLICVVTNQPFGWAPSTGTTGGLEGSFHAGWKAMSQNDPQLYACFHGQRSPG